MVAMEHDLIITNGDQAGNLVRSSIAGAEVLPWRDVLHEGPVPFTEDREELDAIRADYLASRGWATPQQLRNDFESRNRGLMVSEVFDRVALWFEHDLYDQSALVELLARKELLLKQIRRDVRFKGLLDLWLIVHVPFAFATCAALLVHVFVVFWYH